MSLKIGTRLYSTVSDVQVIVVRLGDADSIVHCGGQPMAESPVELDGPAAALDGEVVVGKRYEEASLGLEVLVTKTGAGVLSVNGSPLVVKSPLRLPASD
ncbi:hypothetical protein [Rhodococcus sp. BH4]|uniref:hypothetical protein n=1 Tax=Rhodococcus sp. BH4 TaxID=1807790 RepID=UPI001E5B7AD4|nr:hypothetical protein [Rhodococcus sp. BH4]